MTNIKTTSVIIAAIAIGLVAMIAPLLTTPASAAISPTDTSCTNGGGNQPGGQQPTCSGSGLTQQTENQNPAGSAPPGQNK